MTVVEQVESGKTKTRGRGRKQAAPQTEQAAPQTEQAAPQTEQSEQTDFIDFDDVVTELKQIVAQGERNDWRVGELADRVKPEYGKETLAKVAKKIDGRIALCTLERRRSVYRAWKNISAAPPKSFAVAQELAAHPDRDQIIAAKPTITTREARKEMREYNEQQQRANPNLGRERMKKLFDDLILRATKTCSVANNIMTNLTKEELRNLKAVIKNPALLDEVRDEGQTSIKLADFLQRLVDEPA
jgi:small-conductance mechanosensitive channel